MVEYITEISLIYSATQKFEMASQLATLPHRNEKYAWAEQKEDQISFSWNKNIMIFSFREDPWDLFSLYNPKKDLSTNKRSSSFLSRRPKIFAIVERLAEWQYS